MEGTKRGKGKKVDKVESVEMQKEEIKMDGKRGKEKKLERRRHRKENIGKVKRKGWTMKM